MGAGVGVGTGVGAGVGTAVGAAVCTGMGVAVGAAVSSGATLLKGASGLRVPRKGSAVASGALFSDRSISALQPMATASTNTIINKTALN